MLHSLPISPSMTWSFGEEYNLEAPQYAIVSPPLLLFHPSWVQVWEFIHKLSNVKKYQPHDCDVRTQIGLSCSTFRPTAVISRGAANATIRFKHFQYDKLMLTKIHAWKLIQIVIGLYYFINGIVFLPLRDGYKDYLHDIDFSKFRRMFLSNHKLYLLSLAHVQLRILCVSWFP
jgi:hypothetical protein